MSRKDKSLGDYCSTVYLPGFLNVWGGLFLHSSWIKVLIGAVFEVGWVIGLKHAHSLLEWSATILCITVSFYLLIKAGENLPVGTVYAVFVGLGTTGTILADIVFFEEALKVETILLVALLLAGVIGLKFVTPDDEQNGAEQ